MQVTLLEILEQLQVVGYKMNNIEKIKILNEAVDNINIHINVLTSDIKNNSDDDIIEKPKRENVLSDFLNQKLVLEEEIKNLTTN